MALDVRATSSAKVSQREQTQLLPYDDSNAALNEMLCCNYLRYKQTAAHLCVQVDAV